GEVLVVHEIGTACAPLLFDDLDVDSPAVDTETTRSRRELLRDAPMIGCFAVGLIASITAALLIARLVYHPPAILAVAAALTVGAVGAVVACVLRYRTNTL